MTDKCVLTSGFAVLSRVSRVVTVTRAFHIITDRSVLTPAQIPTIQAVRGGRTNLTASETSRNNTLLGRYLGIISVISQ